MGIYRQTVNELIHTIHTIHSDWTITKHYQPSKRPPMPFFYYTLADPYQRHTFNDVEGEPFSMDIYITAVADDPLDAEDLAHDMRMILQSWLVLDTLATKGVSLDVEQLPGTSLDFGVTNEFEANLMLHLYVVDDWEDNTQPGSIESIGITHNIKQEGNNEQS